MKLKTIVGMGLLAFSAISITKEIRRHRAANRRYRGEVVQIIQGNNQDGYFIAGSLAEVLRGYKTVLAMGYRVSKTGEVYSPIGFSMGRLDTFQTEIIDGAEVLTRESNLEFLERFQRDEDCQDFIRSRL